MAEEFKPPLFVDTFEPDEILRLLAQSTPAMKTDLNLIHLSDYFFSSRRNKTLQFSRKQAGEILGDMDEAESQLADYYGNADENFQIVEGIISPQPIRGIEILTQPTKGLDLRNFDSGGLIAYKVEPNGMILPGRSFGVSSVLWHTWIHRLAVAGIPTYFTTHWVETAKLLSSIYRNEQKMEDEHTTLHRIIKPRVNIKSKDSLVVALVYLSSAYHLGIGEKTATAIAKHYVTLFDIATTSIRELCNCDGVGRVTAEKLLKALRGEA